MIQLKTLVINDVLEDKTKDWKYLLALSENKKTLKEKYGIDIKVEKFCLDLIDLTIKEFENNIK